MITVSYPVIAFVHAVAFMLWGTTGGILILVFVGVLFCHFLFSSHISSLSIFPFKDLAETWSLCFPSSRLMRNMLGNAVQVQNYGKTQTDILYARVALYKTGYRLQI
jgi:hypothetical protein